ncbi:MAG: PLP-dependent aminotransferase family protein [Pseudomonadales bacterium]
MAQPQAQMPRYQWIAQQIEQQIISGALPQGHKLGSIRQLASQHGVSINTIRACFELLVARELVSSTPRIGYSVNYRQSEHAQQWFEHFTPDSQLPEQTQRWLSSIVQGSRARTSLVQMTLPPDTAIFKSYQRQLHQAVMQTPKRESEASAGVHKLRMCISDLYRERNFSVAPGEVQITSGCQHAIEHALRVLCQPGDTVAVPTPAYPGYFAVLAQLGLQVMELPMSPAGPDPALLEQAMANPSVKVLLINPNCHNPTGITLSDDYKQRIAQWAQRYRKPVIEDDICADLSYIGGAPKLIASYDTQGWCLVVSSVSKLVVEVERIGWCCPGRFHRAYASQFAVSQLFGVYYSQQALARYLRGSRYRSQLLQWRRDIHRANLEVQQRLRDALGETVQITQPSGGYALWIKLPPQLSAAELHRRIDSARISFLSGDLFSSEQRFKQFIRLIIMPPLTLQTLVDIDYLSATIAASVQERDASTSSER